MLKEPYITHKRALLYPKRNHLTLLLCPALLRKGLHREVVEQGLEMEALVGDVISCRCRKMGLGFGV